MDPGEARSLLEQAWAGGVVLDYVPVTSDEDLGDGEVLRRVVLFTARGLCVVRGLDPGPEIDPSSIPSKRITLDEFYGWGVDREAHRVLMLGNDVVKRDFDRYQVWSAEQLQRGLSPHPWIWSNDPDQLVGVEHVGDSGYGGAFLQPPYDITLQPRAAQDLFFAIDDALLRSPDADTEIWKFESEWDPMGACWSPYTSNGCGGIRACGRFVPNPMRWSLSAPPRAIERSDLSATSRATHRSVSVSIGSDIPRRIFGDRVRPGMEVSAARRVRSR